MVWELKVFSLWRDVLSRIAQGIDLYTSDKFCALNANLNNIAAFSYNRQSLA